VIIKGGKAPISRFSDDNNVADECCTARLAGLPPARKQTAQCTLIMKAILTLFIERSNLQIAILQRKKVKKYLSFVLDLADSILRRKKIAILRPARNTH
jgi:hypothetical protein